MAKTALFGFCQLAILSLNYVFPVDVFLPRHLLNIYSNESIDQTEVLLPVSFPVNFITAIVVNPPEKKLVKCSSVHWSILLWKVFQPILYIAGAHARVRGHCSPHTLSFTHLSGNAMVVLMMMLRYMLYVLCM